MTRPQRGQIYTARAVYDLDLPDSPCLMVRIEGKQQPVQTSHVSDTELLSDPTFAGTEWEYRYTTNEWIPVFEYAGTTPLNEFLTWEPYKDPYYADRGWFWVTPRHCPRVQYYG